MTYIYDKKSILKNNNNNKLKSIYTFIKLNEGDHFLKFIYIFLKIFNVKIKSGTSPTGLL